MIPIIKKTSLAEGQTTRILVADRRGLKETEQMTAVAVVYIYLIYNLHTSLHIAHTVAAASNSHCPPLFPPLDPLFLTSIKVETFHSSSTKHRNNSKHSLSCVQHTTVQYSVHTFKFQSQARTPAPLAVFPRKILRHPATFSVL